MDARADSCAIQGNTIIPPLYGAFAFSPTEVWLCGDVALYGNGTTWTTYDVRLLTGYDSLFVTKCWGTNPSNMYFCGMNGSLVHYTSGSWTKITSGTDLNFLDIYGSGSEILAIGLQYSNYSGHIFSIAGNTAQEISSYPIKYGLYGVWFVPKEHYYLVGEGVYEKSSLSDSTWTTLPITGAATTGVRGNGTNDVYVVSSTGDFLHWNGERWKSFRAETGLSGGGYSMVGVNGKLVIAVGSTNSGITQAAITVARRN